MPKSIGTELMFRQNLNFVQKVKLFQLSDISFVIALMRNSKPMICMAGDHIVRKGELAESMYFIKRGLAKVVCADDEAVVISFLSEGAYFGEIGVLVTGKRSTSVIAHTDCMLLSIEKQLLLNVLDEFGHHKKFLEMVAQQRLETTNTSDVQIAEPSFTNLENTNSPKGNSENLAMMKQDTFQRSGIQQRAKASVGRKFDVELLSAVVLAVFWNLCYTVFALCFEVDITAYRKPLLAIDIIALSVYAADATYQSFFVTRS